MPNVYVTQQGARLEREAGQLIVAQGDETLLAVPAGRVESVVLVGNVGVTTPALGLLLERRIGLILLTAGGVFRGRLSADLSKNVSLRRRQYERTADDAFCLRVGRAITDGKIRNCRTFCMRLDTTNRDPLMAKVIADLRAIVGDLDGATCRDALLGLEGQAARRYFAALRHHLRLPWRFERRARRPPPDPVNALFSLLYTLLHESCYAALEAVGLDPACGVLHQPRYGRASLALDLMEEFRPIIADSVALTLLNKRMLAPGNFVSGHASKGIYLDREGWRIVAEGYALRLRALVRPDGVTRRISYQRLLEVQARRLRKAIEGEGTGYEPFLAK